MNTYIAWVEMDRARIFRVRADGPEIKILHRHEIRHHTSRDPENLKNCDKFFKKVTAAIRDADELLLMGPGLTKEHFRTYLEEHDELLSRCVVGALTLDLETDAQLMARSREFFKEYDMFGQVTAV